MNNRQCRMRNEPPRPSPVSGYSFIAHSSSFILSPLRHDSRAPSANQPPAFSSHLVSAPRVLLVFLGGRGCREKDPARGAPIPPRTLALRSGRLWDPQFARLRRRGRDQLRKGSWLRCFAVGGCHGTGFRFVPVARPRCSRIRRAGVEEGWEDRTCRNRIEAGVMVVEGVIRRGLHGAPAKRPDAALKTPVSGRARLLPKRRGEPRAELAARHPNPKPEGCEQAQRPGRPLVNHAIPYQVEFLPRAEVWDFQTGHSRARLESLT